MGELLGGQLDRGRCTEGDRQGICCRKKGKSRIYDGKTCSWSNCCQRRARLVTVAENATLREATRLPCTGNDILVVCGTGHSVMGVLTKTDIVARISECHGAACTIAASSAMSADVLLCVPRDLVHDVWAKMQARQLRNAPIADVDGRPLGVLNAQDALGVLLQDAKYEEALLRDYVMGVGYR